MNIQLFAKCNCPCHSKTSMIHFKECCDNGYTKVHLLLVLLDGRDKEDLAVQYSNGQIYLMTGEGPIDENAIRRAYDYPVKL